MTYRARPRWLRLAFWLAWGPGLVVMLADTDAGSLITASQSGAQWGYRMILPQILLVPVLYVVQEITVRLGIVTGEGHGALIRRRFGRWWALLSAGTLFASAIGALLTEFAGIAGVGELFGIPRLVSVPVVTVFLLALALTGSYQRVERIGIAVGLAELAFIVAMVLSRPHLGAALGGVASVPWRSSGYLLLIAANVGAVIMPWMIFYQQGAVIDKRLSTAAIRQARADTAIGAVLTQVIMIAVVIAVAATIGGHDHGAALRTVGEIAGALTPYLGSLGGTVLFGLGMLGAALVAAIVSSLAGAWGLAEVFRLAALTERAAGPSQRGLLPGLRRDPPGRGGPGADQHGPDPAQYRRRGDERAAAAGRARFPARARGHGAAEALADARPAPVPDLGPVPADDRLRPRHAPRGAHPGVTRHDRRTCHLEPDSCH